MVVPTEELDAIRAILELNGEFACGIEDPQKIVQEWFWATSEEVEEWIETARCFNGTDAHKLAQAGITPEQASKKIEIGGIRDTTGYWYCNGDISISDIEIVKP